MANWKKTLDISDLHQALGDGTMSITELAKSVHERCMSKNMPHDCEFLEIANAFLGVEDVEDYDDALSSLYDYGDFNHRLWIKTLI